MCSVFFDSLFHVSEEFALTVFNTQIFFVCSQSLCQADVVLDHEFPLALKPVELLVLLLVEVFAEVFSVHLVRGKPLDGAVNETVVLTQVFHSVFVFAEVQVWVHTRICSLLFVEQASLTWFLLLWVDQKRILLLLNHDV